MQKRGLNMTTEYGIKDLIFYKSDKDYRFVEIDIKKIVEHWLKGFNTNSATDCFTAVQELKKKWGIDIM